MEFKGRIYKVMEVQKGTSQSGNEWMRQDFIFEYFEHDTDRYSDKVLLSVMNDGIRNYDIHEGDECLIGFGHGVRQWKDRWLNEVRMYKFEKLKKSPYAQQTAPFVAAQNAPQAAETKKAEQLPTAEEKGAESEKEGDLPF